MRRKAQYFKRTRNGLWLRRGQWSPTYVFNQHPTAQEAHIPVAKIAVFPVDDHNQIQWFAVS